MPRLNVLIIGQGGREHAFAKKISESKLLNQLFCLPGNAGTATIGNNVNLQVDNFEAIGNFCIDNKIGLVLVGPEQPLIDGLGDYFKQNKHLSGIAFIGPDSQGAQLEGSKQFAKQFMLDNGIPTAKSLNFGTTELRDALNAIDVLTPPFVIKADGPAAGKGVIITSDPLSAKNTITDMLSGSMFGKSGQRLLIEEFMKGIEVSMFVLTDGDNYVLLPEAKDYKRIGDNDTGPNTGGMGAVSPVPFVDKAFTKIVEEQIIIPTLDGLKKLGIVYKGFIFLGLMNVNGQPKVIEYNVRMGDPETQAVLSRLNNDLLELLLATYQGKLNTLKLGISDLTAVTVVAVAGGYPADYKKGDVISGVEKIKNTDCFLAGVTHNPMGNLAVNGGRVLACTALAPNIDQARNLAYADLKSIRYAGMYYRTDIGLDLI